MDTDAEKVKILVVEDEITQRTQLRLKLEEQGYEVIEAVNGWEGTQRFLNNPDIRLVITDLLMPEMDGFQFIEFIREMQARYVYIIVLSILEDKESIIKALSLGADDYICKPVFKEELILRLKAARRLLKLESQDELIFAMAKLASYNSGETGNHLYRIREYCRLIALDLVENNPELKLNKSICREIADVSPLHDLGKVTVPKSILAKEDNLTKEEFEIIKSHAIIGGKMLEEIYLQTGSSYLRRAYEMAMYHHEHWNGNGYPEGRAGEEIPLAARILALADVLDALTAQRGYKQEISYGEARKIVAAERGEQFDPKIVDACLRQEEKIIQIMEEYKEEKK